MSRKSEKAATRGGAVPPSGEPSQVAAESPALPRTKRQIPSDFPARPDVVSETSASTTPPDPNQSRALIPHPSDISGGTIVEAFETGSKRSGKTSEQSAAGSGDWEEVVDEAGALAAAAVGGKIFDDVVDSVSGGSQGGPREDRHRRGPDSGQAASTAEGSRKPEVTWQGTESWSELSSRLNQHVLLGRSAADPEVAADIAAKDRLVAAARRDGFISNAFDHAAASLGSINMRALSDPNYLRNAGLTRAEVVELAWNDAIDRIASVNPNDQERQAVDSMANSAEARNVYGGMHEAYQRGLVHIAEKAKLDAQVANGLLDPRDPALLEINRKVAILGFGPIPGTIRAIAAELAAEERKQAIANAKLEADRRHQVAMAQATAAGAGMGGVYREPNWAEVEVHHDESFFNEEFFRKMGIPVTWGKQKSFTQWDPVDMIGSLSEIAKNGESVNADTINKMFADLSVQEGLFPTSVGLTASERVSLLRNGLLPLMKVLYEDNGTIDALGGKSDVPNSSILQANGFNEMKVANLLEQPAMANVREALGIFFALETPVAGVRQPRQFMNAIKTEYEQLKTATKSSEMASLVPVMNMMLGRVQGMIGNGCSLGEVSLAFEYFKLFGMSAMNFHYGKLMAQYNEKILHGDGVAPFTGVVGRNGEPAAAIVKTDRRFGVVIGVETRDEERRTVTDKMTTGADGTAQDVEIRPTDIAIVQDLATGDEFRLPGTELGKSIWPIINNGLKVGGKYLGTYLAQEGVEGFLAAVQGLGGLKLTSQWADIGAIRKHVGEIGRMVRRDGDEYVNTPPYTLAANITTTVRKELRKPAPSTLITEATAKRLTEQPIVPGPGVVETARRMAAKNSNVRTAFANSPMGRLLGIFRRGR